MHKTFMLFAVLFITINASFAQRKPSDPKHENHYVVKAIVNDDYAIEFVDAQSQQEFSLVKITITNKTVDYLYFKGTDSKFIYDFGTVSPTGGLLNRIDFFIKPNDHETKTLKVTGGKNFHVDKLKLDLNCLYKVAINGKKLKTPDFQLPASKNTFTTGDFHVSLEKSKQTTKETSAEFKCTYTGKEIGLVNPAQLSVKLKDGQEFANNGSKDKIEILRPGDDCKFYAVFNIPRKIADMQFTVLTINWNDTFGESALKLLKVPSSELTLDESLTLLKNK